MIEALKPGRPAFLASVTSAAEARLALAGGADILDCKDPAQGALGALDRDSIRDVVSVAGASITVSATLGDIPAEPRVLVDAAEATAKTGAQLLKCGLFGECSAGPAIAALGKARIGSARMVAVLMADRNPDFGIVPLLAQAGFAGVMIDTAEKRSGALPEIMNDERLFAFVDLARAHGLFAGLAGSLRLGHIAALVRMRPDVLGFRGALCSGSRTGELMSGKVRDVRNEIDAALESAKGDARARCVV